MIDSACMIELIEVFLLVNGCELGKNSKRMKLFLFHLEISKRNLDKANCK